MSLKGLTFLVTLLLGLNSIAQNEFNLGSKAGVNYSGFNVDGSSAYTDAFGYHIGFIGEYVVTKRFSFQSELNFIQKTGSGGTPSELSAGTIKSDLNYLDIPIMVKYYLFDHFAIESGPQLNILISESTEVNYYTNNELDGLLDLKTNGLQLSFNLGFSYTIVDKYLLQLRYSHGLSDIYQDLEAKNTVFSFSVGYFFL